MSDLSRIQPVRRSACEAFHNGGDALGFELAGFWQWSASDLVSNATRGILAEYLVAKAVGADAGVRDEWATYELLDPRGISIEVKSAAYLQSWYQKYFSDICFRCGKTMAWNPDANTYYGEAAQNADSPSTQ